MSYLGQQAVLQVTSLGFAQVRGEVGHPSGLSRQFLLVAIHGKLFFGFNPSAFTSAPLRFHSEFACQTRLIWNRVTPETPVCCMKVKTAPMLHCLRGCSLFSSFFFFHFFSFLFFCSCNWRAEHFFELLIEVKALPSPLGQPFLKPSQHLRTSPNPRCNVGITCTLC